MLTENIVLTGSIKAAAALATKHRFVNFTGNYCGANAKAAGVLAQPTLMGDMAPVNIIGLCIVEAGGAITAGKRIASDASGRAVQATAVSATIPAGATQVTSSGAQPASTMAGGELPQPTNGVAWTDAAEAGDLILALING